MNKSTEEILETRKKHFIATANHYYKKPLQLVRAKGVHVYDETGKEYLDCIGGIVCISVGHNHPKIKEMLQKMIGEDEIQHTSVLYLNKHPTELAKEVVKEAPNEKIDRVFFTNSGSEANEAAFMAARHATNENTIVNLRHGYHGGTSGTLAACGHHSWKFRNQPTNSVVSAIEPNCYRCPYGKTRETCSLECAKDVEKTIQTATHGRIAGMIVEPVMGVGGFITPDKEYFHAVTKIVHNYGGKYISDEVQTGAGRSGSTFLMSKELGIDCDMVTMAKGFGNGAAIGACMMTTEISDAMKGKLFFNTFGSNPFQTAQAKATMEIIRDEKLIENAKLRGEQLRDGFNQLAKKHKIIGDVRGRGLMVGVELVKNRDTKEYATQETIEIMESLKEKGILVGKGGLYANVIRVAPPMSITASQCEHLLKVCDEIFSKVPIGA